MTYSHHHISVSAMYICQTCDAMIQTQEILMHRKELLRLWTEWLWICIWQERLTDATIEFSENINITYTIIYL